MSHAPSKSRLNVPGGTPRRWAGLSLVALALAAPAMSSAGDRVLATWGVSQVEGAAGGGLTPWAVIAGQGSSNQIGGSAFVTRLKTGGNYELQVVGAAVGIHDRVELSMSRWSFKLSDVVPGRSLDMGVIGAKVKVAGDALYDQDRWMPQVSVGMQYKDARTTDLVKALGASDTTDIEIYATATKLWLGAAAGRNVLAAGAVRLTRANQFGLIGFGGPGRDARRLQLEGSVGIMLRDDLVLGAEYRMKPNNLAKVAAPVDLSEDDAWDLYVAWFPHRSASFTLAWVNLGNIAGKDDQAGLYLSGQLSF